MVSEKVMGFFPHESIRKGQVDLIVDLEKSFSEGKILLAHAPTGLGKTASVLSVAIQHAKDSGKKVFFLTNRHTQHQIAVNTLNLIRKKTGEEITCVDLIGKRWMCNQEISNLFGSDFNDFCKTIVQKGECEFYNNVKTKKGLSVDAKAKLGELKKRSCLHNEELISFGQENKMCSYELALAMAKEADVLIGDYYYLFNPFVQGTLFNKLELEMSDVILVVDEGHNLHSRVTDMLSNNLSSIMIKNSIMEAKKFRYSGMIFWLQELMRILNEIANFNDDGRNREKVIDRDTFVRKVKAVVDYEQFISELELAADEIRKKQRKSYLGGIATFLDSWLGENNGYLRYITEQQSKYGPILTLRYSCLDPSLATKNVFSQVNSGVVMSGTLKPTLMYSDLLGIERKIEKEYISPFPSENKLSMVVPQTSTKYNLRGEAMYRKISEICQKISSLIPGNVALFFPSYYLRDQIGEYFNFDGLELEKKIFWEKRDMSKEEKEDFLNEFKCAKGIGGVLLGVTGANFAEGVDFPGDLLNGVVVIGLPLARPDLKTQEIIKYYDQKFNKGWDYGYLYPAMSKCIQSAGRCIRSENDRGVVVYLDERFSWQNYFSCLPREGLIVTKDYQKRIKDFFAK